MGMNLLFLKWGTSSNEFSKGVEVSQVPCAITVGISVSKFCRKSFPKSLSHAGQRAMYPQFIPKSTSFAGSADCLARRSDVIPEPQSS